MGGSCGEKGGGGRGVVMWDFCDRGCVDEGRNYDGR